MHQHQFLSATLTGLTVQALPAAKQAQTCAPYTMSPADTSRPMEQEVAAWGLSIQKARIKLD